MSTTFPETADKLAFVEHLRKAGLTVTKNEESSSWHVKVKYNNFSLFRTSDDRTVVPEQVKPMLKSFLKKHKCPT